jgi:hypothetical protein
MNFKEYTRPLKEIIAELQAVEDAHPGILATLDDHEYGAHPPKFKVAPVYVNASEHVIVLTEEAEERATKLVKQYSEQTAEEMWDSYGPDKGFWKSFEEFAKSHKLVKEMSEKDLREFATAVPMLVMQA